MAIVQINIMKTKPLTFLLALTFMFLFSGSSVVFGDDFQDAIDAANSRKAHGPVKNKNHFSQGPQARHKIPQIVLLHNLLH